MLLHLVDHHQLRDSSHQPPVTALDNDLRTQQEIPEEREDKRGTRDNLKADKNAVEMVV